jgi:hypothetical protein
VDVILEQLGIFWANTEVILDLLTKKGQHVEQFIGFSSKPRLMARFRERMEEYKRFWEGISMMCTNYVAGIHSTNEQQPMYGFLEKSNSVAGDSTDGLSTSMKGDSIESIDGNSNTSGAGSSAEGSFKQTPYGSGGFYDDRRDVSYDSPLDQFKSLKVKP